MKQKFLVYIFLFAILCFPTISGNQHVTAQVIQEQRTGLIAFFDDKDLNSFGIFVLPEVFVIDAGHGGYDSGIQRGNLHEKDITLSIARDISNVLTERGDIVFLTRKDDYSVSIRERIDIVNQKNPDFFISIHVSSENEFVIYSTPQKTERFAGSRADIDRLVKNIAVAKNIMHNLKDEFKINVRHKNLPIPIIAHVSVPAVLIELPDPEKFRYDRNTKDRLINAILNGIT